MTEKIFEISALIWGIFGILSVAAFLICSAEYVTTGNMDYLQRLVVVESIALLVLLAASAAVLGVVQYVWRDKK